MHWGFPLFIMYLYLCHFKVPLVLAFGQFIILYSCIRLSSKYVYTKFIPYVQVSIISVYCFCLCSTYCICQIYATCICVYYLHVLFLLSLCSTYWYLPNLYHTYRCLLSPCTAFAYVLRTSICQDYTTCIGAYYLLVLFLFDLCSMFTCTGICLTSFAERMPYRVHTMCQQLSCSGTSDPFSPIYSFCLIYATDTGKLVFVQFISHILAIIKLMPHVLVHAQFMPQDCY